LPLRDSSTGTTTIIFLSFFFFFFFFFFLVKDGRERREGRLLGYQRKLKEETLIA
jgi:predicted PurR-regulated permease PerM